jgi:hypothetical protein
MMRGFQVWSIGAVNWHLYLQHLQQQQQQVAQLLCQLTYSAAALKPGSSSSRRPTQQSFPQGPHICLQVLLLLAH